MMDYKVPCVILTIISPVLLFEAPQYYPQVPVNRRNSGPDNLTPFHGPQGSPYRFETPLPQYNRPVRATSRSDQVPVVIGKGPKRFQRAPAIPGPRYAKFTLDDASAGYLNLPHGFQNPIKPAGFQPGNLFTAYKYGPAIGHVPLNSLGSYYGAPSPNANRGPVIYPDSQTEKPIEEPLQEAPLTPTPVAELTKAAVLHQHMFVAPSTVRPVEIPEQAPENVEYEIKYVPVYVDEQGKEVKTEDLAQYRLRSEVEAAKSYAPAPTRSSVSYNYVPAATSYKYESQKFLSSGYESSVSSSSGDHHDDSKDYPHYAPKYEFGYRVHDAHTGSDFGQAEHRDGDVTKGSYHVLLPDGRHQTVNYWSDDSGFHAKVKYDGVAKHYPTPTKAYNHGSDSNAIHS